MGFEITLCLVPRQIEIIFAKGLTNSSYAEAIQFVPDLLTNPKPYDYQDDSFLELKKDVENISHFFNFTEEHKFYDGSRSGATIDYLLTEYIKANAIDAEISLLWNGGKAFPNITAGQGMSIRLYEEPQVNEMFGLLADLEFGDLLVHYDYDKMEKAGVYKLKSLDKQWVLEEAFYGEVI